MARTMADSDALYSDFLRYLFRKRTYARRNDCDPTLNNAGGNPACFYPNPCCYSGVCSPPSHDDC
jgi:hypothetical protein